MLIPFVFYAAGDRHTHVTRHVTRRTASPGARSFFALRWHLRKQSSSVLGVRIAPLLSVIILLYIARRVARPTPLHESVSHRKRNFERYATVTKDIRVDEIASVRAATTQHAGRPGATITIRSRRVPRERRSFNTFRTFPPRRRFRRKYSILRRPTVRLNSQR